MRPLALTLAGATLGLSGLLPLARQLTVAADAGAQVSPAVPSAIAMAAPDATPASPSARASTVTATGPVVATRYGPVQVRVVVTGHRLVSAQAVVLPAGDAESRQINRHAGPLLARQAVITQGTVDTVSGATWTSDGYRRSLQAALDAARAAVTTPKAG